MENKIAVIIPAYKDTYLLNTLISINTVSIQQTPYCETC